MRGGKAGRAGAGPGDAGASGAEGALWRPPPGAVRVGAGACVAAFGGRAKAPRPPRAVGGPEPSHRGLLAWGGTRFVLPRGRGSPLLSREGPVRVGVGLAMGEGPAGPVWGGCWVGWRPSSPGQAGGRREPCPT